MIIHIGQKRQSTIIVLVSILVLLCLELLYKQFAVVQQPIVSSVTDSGGGSSGTLRNATFNISKARSRVGSWMGNNWIPPDGWKIYSTEEIQRMFRNTTILFHGDSTARRAARTLFLLLNSTSTLSVPRSALDDLNVLDNNPDPLTKDGSVRNQLAYCLVDTVGWVNKAIQDIEKLKDLEKNTESHVLSKSKKNVDVVVFMIGTWDEGNKGVCGRYHDKNKTYAESMISEMTSLFKKLNRYQRLSGNTLIWRTNGFFQSGSRKSDAPLMRTLNQAAMNAIEGYNNVGFTYVNYGESVEPRSFGQMRIDGGHVSHYGFEGRFVLLQMLVNQLVELRVLSL